MSAREKTMNEEKIRKFLSIAVLICGAAVAIICTVYQNYFYRVPHQVVLSGYNDGGEPRNTI